MVLLEGLPDFGQAGLDACTLNNALNIAQLITLVAILKWVRSDNETNGNSRK